MKTIIKNIIIYILFLSVLYANKVKSKDVINILINKPDINETQYLKRYNEIIKQYFLSKNNNNYDINFSYCVPNPNDGDNITVLYTLKKGLFQADPEFSREFNCTLRELKNSNYDMMIVDDRFLFSDYSYLDNSVLQAEFAFRKLTDFYENYYDLNINQKQISYHNKNFLRDGYYNDNEMEFYGLPYEFDFDMLYYHQDNTILKDVLSVKVNTSSELNNSQIFSAGFGDNDVLLNFFTEFIKYQYNIPKENDPLSYNLLYDSNNHELYNSFRNYMIKLTGRDISKTLKTSIIDAYNAFINNEKSVFMGKASYSKILKENSDSDITILTQSLPDGQSVINEKFIIINKKSNLKKDILLKVALDLTSPEFQLYRAQELNIIPTFDMKDKSNNFVNIYCQQNPDICEMIEKLNPIRINKVYRRSKYSANLMEIRLVVPLSLKKFLIENNSTIIEMTFSNIIDLWNNSFLTTLKFSSFLVVFLIINAFTIITALLLIIVMIMVHRNRKHPYIKAMSPQLSNLTIFGMILRIIYPYFFNLVNTRFLCRLSCVVNFFINNLVYIPLFAIIFRIYYIFTNSSSVSDGKKLHDKRLIKYIILALFLTLAAFYGITFTDEFNLITSGTLTITRSIACVYNFDRFTLISNIYTLTLFVFMLGMTFKVHKISKKYGDTRFIFFIVVLLLSSFIFEMAFSSFMKNDDLDSINSSSIILINVHLLTSIITVHILIGNRLLYVRKYPYNPEDEYYNNYFDDINNIIKYIPVKKNSNFVFSFSLFSKTSSSSNRTNNKSGNSFVRISRDSYSSFRPTFHSYNNQDIYSQHSSLFNSDQFDEEEDKNNKTYSSNKSNGNGISNTNANSYNSFHSYNFNNNVYNHSNNNSSHDHNNNNINLYNNTTISMPKASLHYSNNLK
ncbi:hypothetical protein PIROE2DRAFT_12243 [Piromyces sp. E2]|nr:hypothetical protein PIROE2DRAFT_12243 [Piromyces sp. E2]|eukprot:OUM61698.1 hypothetical protein PIROE2DRAFT_12243 [Piromyces sp. E2]